MCMIYILFFRAFQSLIVTLYPYYMTDSWQYLCPDEQVWFGAEALEGRHFRWIDGWMDLLSGSAVSTAFRIVQWRGTVRLRSLRHSVRMWSYFSVLFSDCQKQERIVLHRKIRKIVPWPLKKRKKKCFEGIEDIWWNKRGNLMDGAEKENGEETDWEEEIIAARGRQKSKATMKSLWT